MLLALLVQVRKKGKEKDKEETESLVWKFQDINNRGQFVVVNLLLYSLPIVALPQFGCLFSNFAVQNIFILSSFLNEILSMAMLVLLSFLETGTSLVVRTN